MNKVWGGRPRIAGWTPPGPNNGLRRLLRQRRCGEGERDIVYNLSETTDDGTLSVGWFLIIITIIDESIILITNNIIEFYDCIPSSFLSSVKGTVLVISRDRKSEEDNARFTTVPFKSLSAQKFGGYLFFLVLICVLSLTISTIFLNLNAHFL